MLALTKSFLYRVSHPSKLVLKGDMNRLIWKCPLADGCCFLCLGFKLRAIVVLSLCRFSSLLSLTTNLFEWSFRTYLKAGSFLLKTSKFCANETCTAKPVFKGLWSSSSVVFFCKRFLFNWTLIWDILMKCQKQH